MKQVYDYLKKSKTFFLATDEDGQPRVRPFGAVAEFEGKLYICANNRKDVFRQMLANPRIEISATGEDGSWIRVQARAVQDTRREARVKMLEENPALVGMYGPDDGLFEVLSLEGGKASFCSFISEPHIVEF